MKTKLYFTQKEAYAFSSCTLLSQAEENEIIRHADFSAEAIRCYAEKFQVHLRNNCRQTAIQKNLFRIRQIQI